MAWVKFDDNFFTHPKAIDLSPTAITLFLRSLCYCNQHMTDGRLTEEVVRSWGIARWQQGSSMLQARGLWTMQEGCIEIHDYLDHQRSRAEIQKTSKQRAEAGSKGGKAKAERHGTAKQTSSKVLGAVLAEQNRTEPPSPPTPLTAETHGTKAAYGGEDGLIKAVAEHMARADLERATRAGVDIRSEKAWLAAAELTRAERHADAIVQEAANRNGALHYPLHVEIAEAIDPACGPADGGAARASAAMAESAEEHRRIQAELEAVRSDPDAIRAGAAAAKAALRNTAA